MKLVKGLSKLVLGTDVDPDISLDLGLIVHNPDISLASQSSIKIQTPNIVGELRIDGQNGFLIGTSSSPNGSGELRFVLDGTHRWTIDTSGNIFPNSSGYSFGSVSQLIGTGYFNFLEATTLTSTGNLSLRSSTPSGTIIFRSGGVDHWSMSSLGALVSTSSTGIYIPNNSALYGKNFAGSNDIPLISLDNSNNIVFGGFGANTPNEIVFRTNTSEKWRINSGGDFLPANSSQNIGTSLTRLNSLFVTTLNALTVLGSLSGNADTATKLLTIRNIAATGDADWNVNFDGSSNVSGVLTLANVGSAGTYTKVTVDSKGRVTSGTTLSASDIPNLDASKITTGTISNNISTGSIFLAGNFQQVSGSFTTGSNIVANGGITLGGTMSGSGTGILSGFFNIASTSFSGGSFSGSSLNLGLGQIDCGIINSTYISIYDGGSNSRIEIGKRTADNERVVISDTGISNGIAEIKRVSGTISFKWGVGPKEVQLTSDNFLPISSNIDLGTSLNRWQNVYCNFIYVTNNVQASGNIIGNDIQSNTNVIKAGGTSGLELLGGNSATYDVTIRNNDGVTPGKIRAARFYATQDGSNPGGTFYDVGDSGIGVNNENGFFVSSDFRLKKNISSMNSMKESIKLLNPVKFNWLNGLQDYGFIAQEVYTVFPNSVQVGDDKSPTDENFKQWFVDYSKIVPYLTKALQEAFAEIEELKNRIQILEGN